MSRVISRCLVTGASGFVGRSLCAEMVARGSAVRAVSRTPLGLSGVESVSVGQIDGQTDWGDALRDVAVVIHLAARVHVMHDDAADPLAEFRSVNVAGTERLARSAAASGVRRLVYVSSIKVNGDATYGAERYTEADVPSPQDPYGVSKWEAEQVLQRVAQEVGLEVVIVRPPLVYGAGVKGNFAQMLKVLAKGVPLPLASVRNQRSMVYVGNLADALILCAAHPAAAGQTYLVCDGEDVSTPELLRRLGRVIGRPARLFPCPLFLLELAGSMLGRRDQIDRLLGSLRVDNGKIRRELAWMPPYSVHDGLARVADPVKL